MVGEIKVELDREQIVRAFSKEGFVCIRGGASTECVLNLQKLVTSLLTSSGIASEQFYPSDQSRSRLDLYMQKIQRSVVASEELYDLAYCNKLLAFVRAILGTEDVFVHPRKFLRVMLPQRLDPRALTHAHQDHRYVQGHIDTITAWIPLVDCPREMGGLNVAAASHRCGLIPSKKTSDGSLSLTVDDSNIEWSRASYSVGDVALFHSLTVHSTSPNQTEKIRLSIDVRYQRREDPIARTAMLPNVSFGSGESSSIEWLFAKESMEKAPEAIEDHPLDTQWPLQKSLCVDQE